MVEDIVSHDLRDAFQTLLQVKLRILRNIVTVNCVCVTVTPSTARIV
jgi:hypothetical protein